MSVELPRPPANPDVTWRPPRKDDAAAIVALQDACFAVDGGFREVEAEILERWDSDFNDVEKDALIAIDDDGNVIATAWSYIPTIAVTRWRAFADNYVHPAYRTPEVLEFVLAWWEARSAHRFRDRDDDLERWLWHTVYDWQKDTIGFLEGHGYEPVRYFDELARDLSAHIEPLLLPDGLSARPWAEAPLEDSLRVHNDAFADHWGSQPISEHAWAQRVNEFHIDEASYVVYDGDDPVAYAACSAYPHDFEDKGRSEAWVEGLGTIRSHRKRGIASTLVALAMVAFKKLGMECAMIGVDSENPSGAYQIYEALGFVPDRRSIAYVKVI